MVHTLSDNGSNVGFIEFVFFPTIEAQSD
eukprot:SAG31_NODE_35128_length_326_cov_0.669604_1_plen_28_part_01